MKHHDTGLRNTQWPSPHPQATASFVWRNASLIAALVVALAGSLKLLAGQ